jgi:hypothetical protein
VHDAWADETDDSFQESELWLKRFNFRSQCVVQLLALLRRQVRAIRKLRLQDGRSQHEDQRCDDYDPDSW